VTEPVGSRADRFGPDWSVAVRLGGLDAGDAKAGHIVVAGRGRESPVDPGAVQPFHDRTVRVLRVGVVVAGQVVLGVDHCWSWRRGLLRPFHCARERTDTGPQWGDHERWHAVTFPEPPAVSRLRNADSDRSASLVSPVGT
jgi:hypothetical protein